MNYKEQKFPIGTKYIPNGKAKRIHTVIDFLTTTNLAGEKVNSSYVSSHEFLGQTLIDYNVLEITIAQGIQNLKEAKYVEV